MELRPLRYFVAVAEELSFSAAAKKLHLSQPPITEAVKALEDELKVKLFNRTSRKVELTDAGAHLLDAAHGLLSHAERVALSTKIYGESKKSVIRLGFNIVVSDRILPPAVLKFRKTHPHVHLELLSVYAKDSKEVKMDDIADVIVGAYYPPDHIIDSELWEESTLDAVLPQNHPLAKCKKIHIRQLRNELFLLGKDVPGNIQDIFLKFCRNVGRFEPKIRWCPDWLSAITLVSAGEGVMLADLAARWIPRAGRVNIALNQSPRKQWGITWQRSKITRDLLELIDELRISHREQKKYSSTFYS